MKRIRTTFLFMIIMTVITGLFYPLMVTVFATAFFPSQANGSLITLSKKEIGSSLIAQKFTRPDYFWPRPSAVNYNPMPSGGSNLAVSSSGFQKQIATTNRSLTPDMKTASGSGLDPDISIESAMIQLERIAKARHWTEADRLKGLKLIEKIAMGRDLKIFGEPRINVLKLNLELDRMK